MAYKSKELGIETPEPGAPPAITANLKSLAEQIDTLLRKQITKKVELAKLKVTESLELPAESITGTEIAAGIGGKSVKSIIAGGELRENTAYGTLATPDEVTVVLPENGLIAIGYHATWKESIGATSHAAIFLNGVQLTSAVEGFATPQPQQSPTITNTEFQPLVTYSGGLQTGGSGTGYTTDSTTGQLVGGFLQGQAIGGPCYIFAAAGTYKITVQFKSSSGKVIVKNRKLWAWVIA